MVNQRIKQRRAVPRPGRAMPRPYLADRRRAPRSRLWASAPRAAGLEAFTLFLRKLPSASGPPERSTPEGDRVSATAHADDATPLPSGGRGTPRTTARAARAEASRRDGEDKAKGRENGYKKILLLLRSHSGADFSLYKSTTVQRRIARRMVLC